MLGKTHFVSGHLYLIFTLLILPYLAVYFLHIFIVPAKLQFAIFGGR